MNLSLRLTLHMDEAPPGLPSPQQLWSEMTGTLVDAADELHRRLPMLPSASRPRQGVRWARDARVGDRRLVLVRRKFSGLGDWIMAIWALHHVARYAGNFDHNLVLALDNAPQGAEALLLHPSYCPHPYVGWLPPGIAHMVVGAVDVEIPHLVYPTHGTAHFVAGMVAQICAAMNVRCTVPWTPENPSPWALRPPPTRSTVVLAADTDKEHKQLPPGVWGLIAQGCALAVSGDVRCVGRAIPSELCAYQAVPGTLAATIDAVRGARLVVSLEHGIAHLCGALGVPCCVLYNADLSYAQSRFSYPHTTLFDTHRPDLARGVIEWAKQVRWATGTTVQNTLI